MNLTLAFKSDAKTEWEWQKDDMAEAKLTLTFEANVRAGVRFYVAEGALEIGGEAVAEGCVGLDAPEKDKLNLVFYHNGITAKVYVNYTAGMSQGSKSGSDDGNGVFGNVSGDLKANRKNKYEKEWVIHEKLEKKG
ncbi:hypothetical protein [Brenneria tiliae]|uniref:Uncharacterized protein n=1 Tax=Brenneria tiliae TaxID=2914984 RepID=A0ABT0MY74_9GAMM|nr:hypothetical protein [Brenneria tiliae]MCL2894253.1 hypothetical protein [Brenneria tiliae]